MKKIILPVIALLVIAAGLFYYVRAPYSYPWIVGPINDLYKDSYAQEGESGQRWVSLDKKSGFDIVSVAQGDLNNDGVEDAFVWATWCGASCGSQFVVILGNSTGKPRAFQLPASLPPEGILTSSANQDHVKSMNIENGILSINLENRAETLRYRLSGKFLIRVKD